MPKNENVNVVLVHGVFVDGSGWKDVYQILKNDGYTRWCSRVTNPNEQLRSAGLLVSGSWLATTASKLLRNPRYGYPVCRLLTLESEGI